MKKGDLIQFITCNDRHRSRGIILEEVPKDANFRTRVPVYMYYVPSWANLKSGEIWDINVHKLQAQYQVLSQVLD